MPALFPMMSAPENFQVGECVRKFVSERSVSPFCGIVTHIVPSTYKVWVQWPTEHSQEDPETLIKVNPAVFGMPTVCKDRGYDSYEKQVSEHLHGVVPKSVTAADRMAIRVAHTFATTVVGKLVDDIAQMHKEGCSDVQAYHRTGAKYASICSEYIIRNAVETIYRELKE